MNAFMRVVLPILKGRMSVAHAKTYNTAGFHASFSVNFWTTSPFTIFDRLYGDFPRANSSQTAG